MLSCCRTVCILLLVVMLLSSCTQALLRTRAVLRANSRLRIQPAVQTFVTTDSNSESTEKKWNSPSTSLPSSPPPSAPSTTVKTMVFMDGTWLYYSMVQGRSERNCPIERKFGAKWSRTHKVDWSKLPQIIAANLRDQIGSQKVLTPPGVIDITRTSVFTSLRADTELGGARDTMVTNFYKNNFDVHRFETKALQEKCVDIALAVEMLYMATIPGAFDIAVIVTGDKDFMPALEKTRLLGKRVAICSMRNGCNGDLVRIENRIRDFEMIWLDDYLDELIVPKRDPQDKQAQVLTNALVDTMVTILKRPSCATYSSRDMGRELQTVRIGGQDALTQLKERFGSLRHFCELLPQVFSVTEDNTSKALVFAISLSPLYQSYVSKLDRDASAGSESDGTDSEGSSSDEEVSDSRGSVIVNNKPVSQFSYSELLGRDDTKPSPIVAASITKELLDIARKGFEAESTELMSSRTLGRVLQRHALTGHTNALIALKSVYANLYSFCEAHPGVFATEEEVDPEIGGFRVRLLPAELAPSQATQKVYQFKSHLSSAFDEGATRDTVQEPDEYSQHSFRPSKDLKHMDPVQDKELFAYYNVLKVPQLKEQLREANLPTSGTKAVLIERLMQAKL